VIWRPNIEAAVASTATLNTICTQRTPRASWPSACTSPKPTVSSVASVDPGVQVDELGRVVDGDDVIQQSEEQQAADEPGQQGAERRVRLLDMAHQLAVDDEDETCQRDGAHRHSQDQCRQGVVPVDRKGEVEQEQTETGQHGPEQDLPGVRRSMVARRLPLAAHSAIVDVLSAVGVQIAPSATRVAVYHR
jgi:hypothetical protein